MSNAFFVVNTSPANIFTNSLQNDIMLYSASNSQNFRIGSAINSAASLNITSNALYTSNTVVGINTTAPAATLDINGITIMRSNLTFSNTTGSVNITSSGTTLVFPAGSISSTALTGTLSQWSNNGAAIGITGSNVGIGTNTPAATLDVNGISIMRSNLTFSNSTNTINITTSGSSLVFPAGSIPTSALNGTLSQWSNNGAAIGITGSNVGVGTVTPQATLDVNGASIFRGSVTLSNTTGAVSFSNSGNLFAFPASSIPSTAISGVLSQWSNNGANIGLLGSNVGIGNVTPGATLDVTGTVNISSSLTVGGKLTVSNVEYITSNVVIYNSEIINSNLVVCNNFTFSNVSGQVSFSNSSNYIINTGGFSNLGSEYIGSNMIVQGSIFAYSNMTFSNTTGFVTLSNSSNALINSGGLSNFGPMYVQSNLTVAGSLVSVSNLTVGNSMSLGNGSPISAVQPYAFYSGTNTLVASTNATGLFGTVSKAQGILGLTYSAGTFTNTTGVSQTYAFSWTILYNTSGGSGYTAYLTDGTNNYGVSQSLSYSYVSSSAIITLPAGGSIYMILWNSVGCTSTNQMQITCLTPVVTLGTGNIVASQPYGAYSASTVTWPNAAWTVCPFNTVVSATGMTGLVANGSGSFTNNTSTTITAVISYTLFFPPNATNARQAAIWDGTTSWGLVQTDPLQSSDNVNLSSSAVIQIAPGTVIQVRGYQNSGGTLAGGSGSIQIAIISQNAIVPAMIPVTYTQPVLSYSIATVSVPNNTNTTLVYTTNYVAQGNTGLSYNSGTGVFTNTSGSAVTVIISANALWAGLANAGSGRQFGITFNVAANNVYDTMSGTVDSSSGLQNNVTTTVNLAANDYFSLRVWQNSGVTTSLQSSSIQISVLGTPVLCPSTFTAPVTMNSNLTLTTGNLVVKGPTNSYGYPADPTGNTGMISAGNLGMFRNRIINGDMRITQRGNAQSSAISGVSLYTLDRWYYDYVGASSCAVSQNLTTFPNYFYSSLSTVFTTSGTGNYGGLYQYIEGYNFIDFNWGTSYGSTAILSFWINMSITGIIPICVDYYGSVNTVSYYTSFTITTANTWQYITLTIPPPPSSAGFFSTSSLNSKIAAIRFMHTTTANVNGSVTNNTWSTTLNANNSVALNLGSSSWTRYLTGVQLEKGQTNTPFEFRPFHVELQLCQRYFYQPLSSLGNAFIGTGYILTSSRLMLAFTLPITMRIIPTFTITGTAGISVDFDGVVGITIIPSAVSINSNKSSTTILAVNASVSNSFSTGASGPIMLLPPSYVMFSAEL